MKRFLVVSIVACSLLFLASCESATQDGLTTHDEEAVSAISHDEAITNTSDIEIITTSGQFTEFICIDDLASRSMYIVRVEVLDERVEWMDFGIPPTSRYAIFTVNRLRVLDVFKGDAEIGNIMEVKQRGGQLGNEKLVNSLQITLPIGDDLILFLSSWGIENRPMNLRNPTQSAFRIAASDASDRTRSINDELESLGDRNNLILTFDDLAQFSETYMDYNQNTY